MTTEECTALSETLSSFLGFLGESDLETLSFFQQIIAWIESFFEMLASVFGL